MQALGSSLALPEVSGSLSSGGGKTSKLASMWLQACKPIEAATCLRLTMAANRNARKPQVSDFFLLFDWLPVVVVVVVAAVVVVLVVCCLSLSIGALDRQLHRGTVESKLQATCKLQQVASARARPASPGQKRDELAAARQSSRVVARHMRSIQLVSRRNSCKFVPDSSRPERQLVTCSRQQQLEPLDKE